MEPLHTLLDATKTKSLILNWTDISLKRQKMNWLKLAGYLSKFDAPTVIVTEA